MKRHHILLILLLVSIAAYFLNETHHLQSVESNARAQLDLLHVAVNQSPRMSSNRDGKSSSSRAPDIDPAKFFADLSSILKSGTYEEIRKGLEDFQEEYEAQLNSAPIAKLKEICSLLEKDFPFDQKESETARLVWYFIVGLTAKSDPDWAFAKFDEIASAANTPIDAALDTFKQWSSVNEDGMSSTYAVALEKWLDAAQAGGRIEEGNPLVAQLRAEIAAAQGDSSEAVKNISQLPYTSQRKVAVEYIQGLLTPDARRQAIEEFSTALDQKNFPHAVRALADQQGFDAAREILSSASLTPEKHDLAAASIAAADIGPQTPAKAKWLIDTLRSEKLSALSSFADQWAHAHYTEAANWINTIPAGSKRDAAVSGFAPVAAKIDGASAVDWALTLKDPATRDSCLGEVIRNWKQMDAEAATHYIKEKGLPVK